MVDLVSLPIDGWVVVQHAPDVNWRMEIVLVLEAMLVEQFALLRMNTVRDKGHGHRRESTVHQGHGEQRRESTDGWFIENLNQKVWANGSIIV